MPRLSKLTRIKSPNSYVVAALVIATLATAGCGGGPTWTRPIGPLDGVLLSVAGTSPSDLWAVGGTQSPAPASLVLHYDGKAWTRMDAGVAHVLWWVLALSPTDVWIAGEAGTMLHYDGARFTSEASQATADEAIFGVWGASKDALWAVGGKLNDSGVVLRREGGAWRRETLAPPIAGGTWFKVWGAAADDVFLVGDFGTLARWNGSAFSKVDLLSAGVQRQRITTIAGRGASDVYAVGGLGQGLALHWDGSTWGKVPGSNLEQSAGLMGVSVGPGGDAVITGMGGAKFRKRGATWIDESAIEPFADLHAVLVFGPEDAYTVGGDFAVLKKGIVAHYGGAVSSSLK